MVFIKSQEYTDPYGKKSKNIICLEGQTDYKLSLNPETNKFNVTIMVGDYEKFIFEASTEEEAERVMQNMLNYNASKEPYQIFDVNRFMIPEVTGEISLEEIEEGISSILLIHGYENLEQVWREMRDNEIYNNEDEEEEEENYTVALSINETEEIAMNNTGEKLENDIVSEPLRPITSYEPYQVTQTMITRSMHYQ